ncbi:DUF6508 domain-containing protein [Bifidobacterium choloepi]|uniref:DNA-binding protein n=1 Tax=Bifidobacterium choloepi TaxID=2614131 RepID=A0A6I5NFT3_9BIFI|nr:DUF6508 domain-containing protein [Bifidobacterium choloepi]NEG70204.1 DNA-binding protein [Bifidobacterium choloepi]
MVRDTCICGKPLKGLAVTGPHRFTFIPASSLAHYNYDLPFDSGVHLSGGRVLEQCESCGALTFCEYPPLDGHERGDDPLVTYGPGTVYEQCDLASVPTTYRSFRALMSSGVTGGIMFSDGLRANLADLYHTSVADLPSWKVVKDAILDPTNVTLDEWWSASIGRNFVVLYENTKVLRPVASWHRVAGTEPPNPRIEQFNRLNHDPLAKYASDMNEVNDAREDIVVPNDRRRLLAIGNRARLRLLASSLRVGRMLPDVAQWMAADTLQAGNDLFNAGRVLQVDETVYGIWHALVSDPSMAYDAQVDILIRHNAVARITCSCDEGQHRHLCRHMAAAIFEIGRRFQFRVSMPDESFTTVGPATPVAGHPGFRDAGKAGKKSERYRHYADALSLIHGVAGHERRYRLYTSFIEPIEHAAEPLYHIEFMAMDPAGKHKVGFCVYSKVMLSFIEAVVNRSSGYRKVLASYGLDRNVRLDILKIDDLDGDLVEALVAMLVHKEQTNEGSLAEALETGTLLRLLKRLAEIDGQ